MSVAPMTNDVYILPILIEQGVVTAAQVERALDKQQEYDAFADPPLERAVHEAMAVHVLLWQNIVTEEQVLRTLARHLAMDYVDLSRISIAPEVIKMVPDYIARQLKVVPVNFSEEDRRLVIAVRDPMNIEICDSLRYLLPFELEFVCATSKAIYAAQGWEDYREY